MAAENVEAKVEKAEEALQVAEGEDLEVAVQKQVEFYFSSQNLSSDAYLLSLMDADMFVPLEAITKFRKMKELTTDIEAVKKAIRNSQKIMLDPSESKVKPVVDTRRRTLILREVPEGVTVQDVEALFDGEKKPQVVPEVQGFFYCNFEEESDCLSSFFALKDKTLGGAPVKARVKSQSLTKSFYVNSMQRSGADGQGESGERGSGRNQSWMHSAQNVGQMQMAYGTYGYDGVFYPISNTADGRKKGGRGNKARGNEKGRGKGAKTNVKATGQQQGRKNTGANLHMSNFPPLPSVMPASGSDDVPLESGYEGEFKKYGRNEVLAALEKLEVKRPDGLPVDCPVILPEPITKEELEVFKDFPADSSFTFQQVPVAPKVAHQPQQQRQRKSSSAKKGRGRKKSHAGEEESQTRVTLTDEAKREEEQNKNGEAGSEEKKDKSAEGEKKVEAAIEEKTPAGGEESKDAPEAVGGEKREEASEEKKAVGGEGNKDEEKSA
mmetsp:Transcript_30718/g.80297  ORF Transcript_30718/g.80297 Transcript_30718/m.80297 type:complete len:495 (-) Transcript_30718:1530-3014(-)